MGTIIGIAVAVVAILIAWPAFRRELSATSADGFRAHRADISRRRALHTSAAAELYHPDLHLEDAAYLSPAAWRLEQPVPLDRVVVTYVSDPKPIRIDGTSRVARRLLPRGPAKRSRCYSDAISADSAIRPSLWWDAKSYDLRSFTPTDGGVEISCSLTTYFGMVDVCEAVAHEFVSRRGSSSLGRRRLRFRREIGDVFDLEARPFLPAIPTLLLFDAHDAGATFLLHARDGAAVASAAGFKHLFGGQFQPSSRHSLDPAAEADLWLAIARELAEELLEATHADGSSGGRLSWDDPTLHQLDELRRSGSLSVHLVAMGIDPLTLWPDLLAVAVADADAFRAAFPTLAATNSEGAVVGESVAGGAICGFAFDQATVERLAAADDMHPAAAVCLRLAWTHRSVLLDGAT